MISNFLLVHCTDCINNMKEDNKNGANIRTDKLADSHRVASTSLLPKRVHSGRFLGQLSYS